MSKEKKDNEILTLVQHPVAQGLCRELANHAFELSALKSFAKIGKVLNKRSPKAVLVECERDDYANWAPLCQELKNSDASISLIVVLPGSMPLFPPEVDLNSVDLILSLEQGSDHLMERVSRLLDLSQKPKVEGRAKKVVDLILERTASWPKLGDHFEIEEGITMDHPEKHLKSSRLKDSDVKFLLNGQINAYHIKGQAAFWSPDEDLILSGPEKRFLQANPKLLLQASGPPLKATMDREGRFYGRSAYAVLPKGDEELELLCVYLNSRIMDFYFNKIYVPSNSDTSYIRSLDFKKIPLPPKFSTPSLLSCKDRILELEMLLQSGAGKRHIRVSELLEQLDQMIFEQFGFDEVDLHHFEKLHF